MFESNRPTLILVRGVPGSGKSTLAMVFEQLEGIQSIEADDYFKESFKC